MKPAEGYVEVTREEFREFLRNYGTLEHECTTICEPPLHGYYDFGRESIHPIGSMEREFDARQAYCVYDEGMGQGPPHFYVRHRDKK